MRIENEKNSKVYVLREKNHICSVSDFGRHIFRSGCISAQADQDIKTMIKYGVIPVNSAVWIKKTYGDTEIA